MPSLTIISRDVTSIMARRVTHTDGQQGNHHSLASAYFLGSKSGKVCSPRVWYMLMDHFPLTPVWSNGPALIRDALCSSQWGHGREGLMGLIMSRTDGALGTTVSRDVKKYYTARTFWGFLAVNLVLPESFLIFPQLASLIRGHSTKSLLGKYSFSAQQQAI